MHSRTGLAVLLASLALVALVACSGPESSESTAGDGAAPDGDSESVLLDEHMASPFQPAPAPMPATDDDAVASDAEASTDDADPVTDETADAVEGTDADAGSAEASDDAAEGPTLRVVATLGRDSETDEYWHIMVVYTAGDESLTVQSERVPLHEPASVTLQGKWLNVADRLVVIAIGDDLVALSEVGAKRVSNALEHGELAISFGRGPVTDRARDDSTTERRHDQRWENYARDMEAWAEEMERRAEEWERSAEEWEEWAERWREDGERWREDGERWREDWRDQSRNHGRDGDDRDDADAVDADEPAYTRSQLRTLEQLEGVNEDIEKLLAKLAGDDLDGKALRKYAKKAGKIARDINKLVRSLPDSADARERLADVRDRLADLEDRLADAAERLEEAEESEETARQAPRTAG